MATVERVRNVTQPEMTAEEAEMARAAQRCIMAALDHSRAAFIKIETDAGDGPVVQVPPQALRIIAEALGSLSERRPVILLSGKQEMTTVEAAHYLNVSRPFVIKEIEAGRIPHTMVGTHRRILFSDLARYRKSMRERQENALQELADDATRFGLD